MGKAHEGSHFWNGLCWIPTDMKGVSFFRRQGTWWHDGMVYFLEAKLFKDSVNQHETWFTYWLVDILFVSMVELTCKIPWAYFFEPGELFDLDHWILLFWNIRMGLQFFTHGSPARWSWLVLCRWTSSHDFSIWYLEASILWKWDPGTSDLSEVRLHLLVLLSLVYVLNIGKLDSDF